MYAVVFVLLATRMFFYLSDPNYSIFNYEYFILIIIKLLSFQAIVMVQISPYNYRKLMD